MNLLDVLNKQHKPIETGLGLNDKMLFGKYKGELISNMIYKNVSYIHWCIENVESFKLSNEAYEIYVREWERHEIDRESANRRFDYDHNYFDHKDDLPF